MAALIAHLERIAGASDIYTWIGWGCLVGIPAVLYIIVRT